ncbi:MAG: pyridoxamine 5'-phosphate oxidase [Balneolaceae bacterium]|nr:pyridoxamine 5'-phosphate oxidase [Balneolaceae bacterium]
MVNISRFIKRWMPAKDEIQDPKKAIAMIRREYEGIPLDKESVDFNPFNQFTKWFKDAVKQVSADANAMTLTTVGEKGQPSSRTVLLKEFDKSGFVFYTNYQSRKGRHIQNNSQVSITFYWAELMRQIHIEGNAQKVPDTQSDEYFKSRPVASQLGAWASSQSEEVESRSVLKEKMKEFEQKFGDEIPRPPHWGGFLVVPHRIEFWQGRLNRLHDRICYTLEEEDWVIKRLSP